MLMSTFAKHCFSNIIFYAGTRSCVDEMMKIVLLWTILIQICSANQNIDIRSGNHSIECTEIYYNSTIDCKTTLTEANYKEYTSKFTAAAPLPSYHGQPIILNCLSCDLDTIPNEIFGKIYPWDELNFASSHIRRLKMTALNATVLDRLSKLRLRNNSITLLNDESLPHSETITHLDLSHNLIRTVTGNTTFSKIQRLSFLNLAYNCIGHLDPFVFQNLGLLQLDLSNNMLLETSFIDSLFAFHTVLKLNDNPIVNVTANMHVKQLQLRNSSVKNCSIGYWVRYLDIVAGILEIIELSEASDLERLNLSSNHLAHFEFKTPRRLTDLDLCNNKLRTIHLGHANSLYRINLARNNITGSFNMTLPASLVDLNLSYNKITNHDIFKDLQNLIVLNLAHCELHTLYAAIYLPTFLEFIDLSYNRIANLDWNIFNGLKSLKELNLNGNRLTDLNVEDFNSSRLGISENDLYCARLEVIIDSLKRRNVTVRTGTCNQLFCAENINGIACQNYDYEADTTAASVETFKSGNECRSCCKTDKITKNEVVPT